MNRTLLIKLLSLLSIGFIINIYLQLRVWTTPAQVNQTKYALGVGKDIITYYEQYYNLGYPLPKQGEWIQCTSNMYVTIVNVYTLYIRICDIADRGIVQDELWLIFM